jgi:hypothetical protein
MFTDKTLSSSDIHLSTSSDTLIVLLKAIKDPKTLNLSSTPWNTVSSAIELANQFECDRAAEAILYEGSKNGAEANRLDALGVACRQNNHLAATRILLQAHKGESSGGTNYHLESIRPNCGLWNLQDASKLSSAWLWALSQAVEKVEKKTVPGPYQVLDRSKEEFWIGVVGEFMAHLAKCE